MRPPGVLQRELLDELFASVPVALAVVNRELRFTRINGQISELYDRSGDEFTGVTIAEAIPSRAAEIEPLVLRALAGEAIRGMEMRPRSPSNERRFKASFIPIRSPGQDIAEVLIMVAEHSGNREVERTWRFNNERLDLALEGTRAGIFEWRASDNELRWSAGMGPLFGRAHGWTPAGYEQYMEVVHPEDRESLEAGVTSAMADGNGYDREFRCIWPDGSERWLYSRVQALRDQDQVVLLGMVSDIHERKMRERSERFLASTSFELGYSLDPSETAMKLAEKIVPEFCDWCGIVVFGEGDTIASAVALHSELALTEVAQRSLERFWTNPQRATPVITQVREGRVAELSALTDADHRVAAADDEHLELLRTLHPSSVLLVPMVARGRVVGSICLFASTPARKFDEFRTSIAIELGRRAGIAVDNAALMAAEQRANHRLRHLQTVTDAALDNLELDDLLHELMRRVREITVVDFAIVLLEDLDRGDLQLRAASGLAEDERDIRIGPGEGIAGLVLQSGEPLYVEDVQAGNYVSRVGNHLRKRVKSVLAVPLLTDEGRVIGVLQVGTLAEHRAFSEDERDLLTLVSERAARAIVNASINEQARRTSTVLQGSLLPEALPEMDGFELAAIYRPGQEMAGIGGDWYDVFPLPDGRTAIALGDVVGRGVQAAALMGQLRAATRAYAREHSNPATVIEKVDDLVEELIAVPFATLVLLALDETTGAVEVASAGHLPPVSSSGGLLNWAPGPALGVPAEGRQSFAFSMEPGELLVLYTDGLVEERSEGLQTRLDKLAAEVAAGPRNPEELLEHLERSMLGGGPHDDIAAVVLRRNG